LPKENKAISQNPTANPGKKKPRQFKKSKAEVVFTEYFCDNKEELKAKDLSKKGINFKKMFE